MDPHGRVMAVRTLTTGICGGVFDATTMRPVPALATSTGWLPTSPRHGSTGLLYLVVDDADVLTALLPVLGPSRRPTFSNFARPAPNTDDANLVDLPVGAFAIRAPPRPRSGHGRGSRRPPRPQRPGQ